MQHQPHNQPAAGRDQQQHIPRQSFGKGVNEIHILGPIGKRLQPIDDLAEKQRCGPGRTADHQGNQPELELAWPAMSKHFPRGFCLAQPITVEALNNAVHGALHL